MKCEVCGGEAEVGPDFKTKRHGWICRPCLIATTSCNLLHKRPLDVEGLGRQLEELNTYLQKLYDQRTPILKDHYRTRRESGRLRWIKAEIALCHRSIASLTKKRDMWLASQFDGSSISDDVEFIRRFLYGEVAEGESPGPH